MNTRKLMKIAIPICVLLFVYLVYYFIKVYPLNGTLVCKINDFPSDVTLNYTYTVDFTFRRINTIKTVQIIKSADTDLLTKYEEIVRNDNEGLDSSYSQVKTTVLGDSITNVIRIDYSKAHGKKIKKYSLKKLMDSYEKSGAVCKYK